MTTQDLTITREGVPDEITVTAEYVQRSLSWIDGLDAHEGPISTQNIEDLIAIAREFAKGYAEQAGILKSVLTDRERIRGERNANNAEKVAAPQSGAKAGTLAYAQAVHDDMTDPRPKPGETETDARARRDYYRGYDDDGLPSD